MSYNRVGGVVSRIPMSTGFLSSINRRLWLPSIMYQVFDQEDQFVVSVERLLQEPQEGVIWANFRSKRIFSQPVRSHKYLQLALLRLLPPTSDIAKIQNETFSRQTVSGQRSGGRRLFLRHQAAPWSTVANL